jgi:uncharacterized membrane protein YkvI
MMMMMMMVNLMEAGVMSKLFAALAAVLWLISAVLWLLSASVEIRANIDLIVSDLQRAGGWNSWAAATACAAALASCAVAACEMFADRYGGAA